LPDQTLYSWDNIKNSILRSHYHAYFVQHQMKDESYFILDPKSGYVAQLGVFSESKEAWSRLFQAIRSKSPHVKINNVDSSLADKLLAINNIGLSNTVNQFEMSKRLTF
ncbi:MAG: N-acetyltransferase, partial [Bacteroidota bacterium]